MHTYIQTDFSLGKAQRSDPKRVQMLQSGTDCAVRAQPTSSSKRGQLPGAAPKTQKHERSKKGKSRRNGSTAPKTKKEKSHN